MTSICIVAHNAFPCLTGGEGHVGGVELQTSLLAKYLAGKGHEVSFITWDTDESDIDEVDGVRIIRLCRQRDGFPGIRFFYPRWSSLRRALRLADAEVYYQNGAEYVTGQVAIHCRSRGRAFIFSAASDTDCDERLPVLRHRRERVLYRIGLKQATRVVVQTEKQANALLQGFGISSDVLPMPCDIEVADRDSGREGIQDVLWVGRIIATKRLEAYIDLAESMPDIQFHVAGAADDDPGYAQQVIERARSVANVVYHGQLDRQKLQALYGRTDALVCTSAREGFPNTFLEAWANGLPVISTFDPDNVIARFGLGYAVEDVEQISTHLLTLDKSPEIARNLQETCRAYFDANHAAAVALPRFEQLLMRCAVTKS